MAIQGFGKSMVEGTWYGAGAVVGGSLVAMAVMAILQHLNISTEITQNAEFGLKIAGSVFMFSSGLALLANAVANRILNKGMETDSLKLQIRDLVIGMVALLILTGGTAAAISWFSHDPTMVHIAHEVALDAGLGAGGIGGLAAFVYAIAYLKAIRDKSVVESL